ncbi:MAG: hypothetical protein PHY29_02805 [Syntrophales bacterium]|nr:hypothetical protein [Syntrophales bacterium]
MKFRGITTEDTDLWRRIYPGVDMKKEFQAMVQWLDRQVVSRMPLKVNKKGRKRSWKKFITNWLKKEQMKAVGL